MNYFLAIIVTLIIISIGLFIAAYALNNDLFNGIGVVLVILIGFIGSFMVLNRDKGTIAPSEVLEPKNERDLIKDHSRELEQEADREGNKTTIAYIKENFDVRPVAGDGNCLFASISLGVGEGTDAKQIRAIAVNYLKSKKGEQLMKDTYLHLEENPRQHIAEMAQNRTFGTSLEVQALANALHRKIIVYTENNTNNLVSTNVHSPVGVIRQRPIFLRFDKVGKHYDLLLPNQDVKAAKQL